MINYGDTAWMLIATALVLMMTPALAFFYGGLVRKKNILSIMMQCFVLMCFIGIQWFVYGYSLAFGADQHGLIGGLNFIFFNNVGLTPNADYAATIPHLLFAGFQMMFAIITPALIIGASAERIKFSSFLLFMLLWATLIYDPVAHWIWGKGGWLAAQGAMDFAGGTVIHVSAGMSALVLAILLGKRAGNVFPKAPHNLPFTILGTGFLWFGWFGFNAGSALGANEIAVAAFMNTMIAAAVGGLTWLVIDWIVNGVPTMLGLCSGIVAGLAGVTQGAGYITPLSAFIIGIVASILCFFFVSKIKPFFGYDDSLDVFGIHCMSGIWGAISTGLFATVAINPAARNGLFYGNPMQLWIQTKAMLITSAVAIIGTIVIYYAINKTIGMRVTVRDEQIGLDLTQHHETGYTLME